MTRLQPWLRIGALLFLLAFQTGPLNLLNPSPDGLPLRSKTTGKLSARLGALQGSVALQNAGPQAQSRALGLPEAGPGSLLRGSGTQIMTYVRLNTVTPAILDTMSASGAQILHLSERYGLVTVLLEPDGLEKISAIPAVLSLREVLSPQVGSTGRGSSTSTELCLQLQGAYVTEGDAQLKANQARGVYHLNGSGVTVGVLSDSFNQNNSPSITTHAAQDIQSGDLPGPMNPCGFTTPVSEYAQSMNIMTDEGRGMLQIVHDLAPAAHLSFAPALNGIPAYADNIRALRRAGADILVDDIFYYEEPFFQEGPVNVAITDVVRSGGLYFTLAGNNNTVRLDGQDVSSYEAPAYRPTACPDVSGMVWTGDCHNFHSEGSPDPTKSLTLGPNGGIQLDLQWAEAWFGVVTDLDIYLLDDINTIVAYSNDNNPTITQTPFEFVPFSNSSALEKTYRIVINRSTGSAQPRLKFIFLQGTHLVTAFQPSPSNGPDITGPSLFGHSATTSGISVAAVPYSDATTPEPYSSRGPAVLYFGPVVDSTPAAALPPLVINQPDLSATDGGCTTFFGIYYSFPPPGCFRFYGTSAAAPHAAGAAALLLERANQLHIHPGNLLVKTLLQTTVQGVSGPNPAAAGSGLIDILAAVVKLDTFSSLFLPVVQK